MPCASIIVVAHAAGATLQACVDSIRRQTVTDFEVLIVDNGPPQDHSVDLLQGLDARFRVLKPGANLGFAGANNLAARQARGRWLALLNPDAFAETDWLERLIAAAQATGAAMIGSQQMWADHPGLLDGAGDAYHAFGLAWRGHRGKPIAQAPPAGETFAPCAAAALYDRAAFLSVGGFDERFFAYHEDVDLAFRLRLMGHRALQTTDARVAHVGSGAPGEAHALAVRLGSRNRIWTFVKCMPGLWVYLLAPGLLGVVLVSLARDIRRGRGGAALTGIGEAMKALPAVWRDRRAVQHARRAAIGDILAAFTWSPLPIIQTAADIRAWKGESPRG